MVDEYLSDEERLEMAKKWWLENYKSIFAGALIAVVVVGGWRYWEYRTISRSQTAAALFNQLAEAMAKQDKDGALKAGNQIVDKYADTPYAAHAALALAQLQASTGKPADGEQMLDWVMKNGKDDGLKLLARLRLARVKLAMNDAQGALDTLNGAETGGFAPLYDD
ncbi:MAG: YfgM family protein, partial [Chloroflexota bacterium]